jgi:pentatricopeptide repeat domain-containing protein 1
LPYVTLTDDLSKTNSQEEALKLFDKMLGKGIRPNNFVVDSVFNGFKKYGKMTEASILINNMLSKGVSLYRVNYTSFVDGLLK